MTRFLGTLLVLGVTGLVANPTPADAQASDTEHRLVQCMNEAVGSCNEDFPPGGWRESTIRGWCYLIRTALCD